MLDVNDLELGRTKFQTGMMLYKKCTKETTLIFTSLKKNTDKIVEPLSQVV
jgi:hypothetical protein